MFGSATVGRVPQAMAFRAFWLHDPRAPPGAAQVSKETYQGGLGGRRRMAGLDRSQCSHPCGLDRVLVRMRGERTRTTTTRRWSHPAYIGQGGISAICGSCRANTEGVCAKRAVASILGHLNTAGCQIMGELDGGGSVSPPRCSWPISQLIDTDSISGTASRRSSRDGIDSVNFDVQMARKRRPWATPATRHVWGGSADVPGCSAPLSTPAGIWIAYYAETAKLLRIADDHLAALFGI
jgi:hypothetical protein